MKIFQRKLSIYLAFIIIVLLLAVLVVVKTRKSQPVKLTPSIEVADNLNTAEYLKKADDLLAKGALDAAMAHYKRAAADDPQNIWAYLGQAKIFLLQEKLVAAKDNLQKARDIDPKNQEILFLDGKLALAEGDLSRAESSFSQVGDDDRRYFYMGLLAAYNDDYRGADKLISNVNKKDDLGNQAALFAADLDTIKDIRGSSPAYPQVLTAKAMVKVGENDLALLLLKKALEGDSEYRDAWLMLGYTHLQRRDAEAARQAFLSAYMLDPTKAETQYFLGVAYKETGDMEKAISYLELALENQFKPRARALERIGQIYTDQGKYEQALKVYEDILQEDTIDPSFFIKPVWLAIDKLDLPKEALAMADKALATNSDNVVAINLKVWALLANKKYQEAKQYLDKGLRINSNYAPLYLNLGDYYLVRKDYQQAKTSYNKAYELDSGSIGQQAAEKYNQLVK